MPETRSLILKMRDGTDIHCADFFPPNPAHSGIVFMHGLGEHCGRYAHLAAFFCARGFAVRTYDHRGHGKSSGKRGDIPHQDSLLDDAQHIMHDWQLSCPPSVTRHLMLGHSMGGLFAAKFALSKMSALHGLILSAPALAIYMNFVERSLLTVLSTVAPALTLSNGLKTNYLSHDDAVVKSYCNDPLVHDRISARLLNSMLTTMHDVFSHASSLDLPTLLLVAGQDKLVDSTGSLRFAQASPENYLRLHAYDNLYHEIFNELDAKAVFDDVSTWLDQLSNTVVR
jgi:alpha-beta hydrolase superfamily lysophospholipase